MGAIANRASMILSFGELLLYLLQYAQAQRGCKLVGVEPVVGGSARGNERYSALLGGFHLGFYNLFHAVEFFGNYVEIEFVVYLHDHS